MHGVEESLTAGQQNLEHSSKRSPQSRESSQQPSDGLGVVPRASSPAKRSFHIMSQDIDHSQNDDMELDDAANIVGVDSRATKPSPVPISPPELSTNRAVRGPSVDMLKNVPTSGETEPDRPGMEEKDRPSYDEQLSYILQVQNEELENGAVGYVISMAWLQRPWSRTSEKKDDGSIPKSAREGPVGPVDNTDVVPDDYDRDLRDENDMPFVPLKPTAEIEAHYIVLPEAAWKKVTTWYGIKGGSPEIRRYVHDTAPEGSARPHYQYELRPPIFAICKLRHESQNADRTSTTHVQAPRILASRNQRFQKFLAEAKKRAGIDVKTKVKVWRILETIPTTEQTVQTGILTPATSRSGSPTPANGMPAQDQNLEIDFTTFSEMEEGVRREMIDIKDETNNPNYNGSVKLDTVGLGAECTLILEPQVGGLAGGEYISDNIKSKSKKGSTLTITNGSNTGLKPPNVLSRASSPGGGPVTRSKTRRDGKPRGMVGLTNLGNTCYMNSALQCIRSCEELSLYFLQERYKHEINTNNVLGHKGVLAKTYAGFVSSIYDDTAGSSFAPRNLKNTVGRLDGGSVFSGYGQQDSQEFLSFLVDGLHEDLNRIIKKPSVEDPDSTDDTHKDINLIKELGEVYRNNHRSRNNSIVSDLFNGFYKNTMKCPECGKVSIKFDPYSSLTLQLPLETTWQHMVTFVPIGKAPTLVQVDLKKTSSIRDLKKFTAERFPGTDPKRMMMTENYSHKIFKLFEDSHIICESNIQKADDLVLYELSQSPTNYPPPKKKKKKQFSSFYHDKTSEEDVTDMDSPYADRLLVPVMHRKAGTSTFGSATMSATLEPFFVIITKEESTNFDEIHRKILAHVSGITTFDMFEEKQIFSAANNDSDTVITTEEDASSNTEENVKAASLDSESSIVDVTMNGDACKADDSVAASPDVSTLPEPLRPGAYIPPHIQRMFDMKVVKRGKGMIPSNWSDLSNGRVELPLLASRLSTTPQSRRSSVQSNSTEGSSRSSVEETPDEPAHSFQAGADSDDDLPPVDSFKQKRQNQYSKRGKRRGKPSKMKQYGKNNNRTPRHTSQEPFDDPSDAEESPRLLRLGEGLVLDWEPESFDTLFGRTQSDDTLRGVSVWDHRQKFEDPELLAKMSERNRRRKNGIELDACFEESARTEVLSEENAWYCNRCKEHRTASKTLEIWTAPDILVIHLKRFNSVRNMRDKLDLIVDFPIEGLDISKWVGLPEDKSLVYDLFAVDNHFGGLGGGHYTACAKNFYDGRWYNYNDSVCSSVKAESLVSSSAYLLFYRRRTDAPLGPPYLQQLVHDFWNPPATTESTSRDEDNTTTDLDPSAGNGQRAHGSYPNGGSNGSSSASAAVGSRAGVAAGDARGVRSSLYEDEDVDGEDVDNVLPGYSGPNEHDEDIALESIAGPSMVEHEQSWGWDHLTVGVGRQIGGSDDGFGGGDADAEGEGDNDSTGVMGGSDMGDERLMEDFGDDLMGGLEVAGSGSAAGIGTPAERETYEVFDQTMPLLEDLGREEGVGEELGGVVQSMEFDVPRMRGGEGDGEEVVEVRVKGNEDVKRD